MILLKSRSSYIISLFIMLLVIPIHGSQERVYKCEFCSKTFRVSALALRCGFANNNPEEIKSYIFSNLQDQEVRRWKCPLSAEKLLCNKQTFLTLDDVQKHLKGHIVEPQTCPFPSCLKQMQHKNSLNNHMLKHTSFRPFKCGYPTCEGYYAVQEINVFSHVVTHLYLKRKATSQQQPREKTTKKHKTTHSILPVPHTSSLQQLPTRRHATRSRAKKTILPKQTEQTNSPVLAPNLVTFPPTVIQPRLTNSQAQFLLAVSLTTQLLTPKINTQSKLVLPATPPRSNPFNLPTFDEHLFQDPLYFEL